MVGDLITSVDGIELGSKPLAEVMRPAESHVFGVEKLGSKTLAEVFPEEYRRASVEGPGGARKASGSGKGILGRISPTLRSPRAKSPSLSATAE